MLPLTFHEGDIGAESEYLRTASRAGCADATAGGEVWRAQ